MTTATQLRVTQTQRSRSATLQLLKTTFQLLPKRREVVFHFRIKKLNLGGDWIWVRDVWMRGAKASWTPGSRSAKTPHRAENEVT